MPDDSPGRAESVRASLAKIKFSNRRDWYYSQLEEAVGRMPAKITNGPMLAQWFQKNAPKKEELEWSGLLDYLQAQGKAKVTQDDVRAFLKTNGVKVKDVLLGDPDPYDVEEFLLDKKLVADRLELDAMSYEDARDLAVDYGFSGTTIFGDYTLPGGKDYKELLITLPGAEKPPITASDEEKSAWADRAEKEFQSNHFKPANILAHVRMNERVDAEGKRVLFLEEVQSDWSANNAPKKVPNYSVVEHEGSWAVKYGENAFQPFPSKAMAEAAMARAVAEFQKEKVAGPFVMDDGYIGLAMRRVAAYAVDHGFDKVAWISGEQAHRRFPKGNDGRSTEVGMKKAYDEKLPSAAKKLGVTLEPVTVPLLNDRYSKTYTGKQHTDASLTDLINDEKVSEFEQGNLKTIRSAMRNDLPFDEAVVFYGTADTAKILGGTLAQTRGSTPSPQQGFSITPALKEQVKTTGLPLFSKQRFKPVDTEKAEFVRAVDSWFGIPEKFRGGNKPLVIGSTPFALMEVGAEQHPIQIDRGTLIKLVRPHGEDPKGHGLTLEQVKQLPDQLADPLAVFESAPDPKTGRRRDNSRVVLTTLTDTGGDQVIVALHLSKDAGRGHIINDVSSMHGRSDAELRRWVDAGLSLWFDDTRETTSPAWLTTGRLQLPAVVQAARSLGNTLRLKSQYVKDVDGSPTNPNIHESRQRTADALAEADLHFDIANGVKNRLADIIAPAKGFNLWHKTDILEPFLKSEGRSGSMRRRTCQDRSMSGIYLPCKADGLRGSAAALY